MCDIHAIHLHMSTGDASKKPRLKPGAVPSKFKWNFEQKSGTTADIKREQPSSSRNEERPLAENGSEHPKKVGKIAKWKC